MDIKVNTERYNLLDTYKGLLIIILVAHHIPFVSLDLFHLQNCYWESFKYLRPYLYGPFFMTAFFIATGISSDFDKPFKEFVGKLTMICIPAFFLVPGQWYLYAFVLVKLMYYIFVRLVNKTQIGGG